jgi:putative transposase
MAALKRENARLREENEILKKSRAVLCQGVVMRYRFIRDHAGALRVAALCRAWCLAQRRLRLAHTASQRQAPGQYYAAAPHSPDPCGIKGQLRRGEDVGGAARCWRELRAAPGVARLRQANGVEARRMRRFRSSDAGRNSAPAAPDLLNRDFSAMAPDRVWVGDISYIATREGWLYLGVLIDLYVRRVVGWGVYRASEDADTPK